MFGISAALTTPFTTDGSIDHTRLNTHIKGLLNEGCSSVTLFGTTGEGASVASEDRLATVRAAVDAGIDPAKLVLTLHGAAACAVTSQARQAIDMGVRYFLLPPPCYFSQPSDAGLFNWFAAILSHLGGTGAQIILYHIPQVIGVGLPIDLVTRLKVAFPELVFGVKDSSGSFENSKKLLQLPDLDILIGDERLLAPSARLGASGAISGIANLFPARLARALETGNDDLDINNLVDTALTLPITPAIKALVAHKYDDRAWLQTLAPLTPISDPDCATLAKAYDAVANTA